MNSLKELIENSYDEKRFKKYLKDLNLTIEENQKFEKIEIENESYEYKTVVHNSELSDKNSISVIIVKADTDKDISNARVKYNKILESYAKGETAKLYLMAIFNQKDTSKWKLSLVIQDNTNLKRYTFELGKKIPTTTAYEQLSNLDNNSTLEEYKEAFSVEKLSNEFFKKYKELYHKLLKHIDLVTKNNRKKEQDETNKELQDKKKLAGYIKKMLGRIVFLYFVQKKGWLDNDKRFLSNFFKKHVSKDVNFFDSYLEPLFLKALNTKRDGDIYKVEKEEYIIPFLNGGLFTDDEKDKLDFGFPNEDMEKIFELFDSYNFTIIEDTPHDSEVAVDPEMLGRVFEDLLEDRKDKGAFYTPREIVHYMCHQSINNYLETNPIVNPNDEEKLKYLKQIKILDPAIGSGAFPMGMLHEIVQKRIELGDTTKLSELKKKIIQNSIYGIDIEPSAVEIAKLRFWLSIVVDEEIVEGKSPEPLPNLFYKIMVGNSLLETINSVDPLQKRKKGSNTEKERITHLSELDSFFNDFYKEHKNKTGKKNQISEKLKILFESLLKKYSNQSKMLQNEKESKQNNQEIDTANLIVAVLKDLQKNHFSDKVFLYKLFFKEIIESGGFDVVIGNPPYVRQEKIKELKSKKEIQDFKSYCGTADLYVYFYEKGYNLLKPNGILSYITSNKYTRAKYGKDFRNFLLENTEILNYIDFHNVKVFKSAITDTSILSFKKSVNKNTSFVYCDIDNSYKKNSELEKFIHEKGFEYQQSDLQGDSFSFTNPEELQIKKKIEKVGIPLKNWNIEINRGILTGFNQAFVIDGKTKDELIAKDKKSGEIIKPLLRGRDIKQYRYEFADKWIINTHNNPPIDIEKYPAIKEHLDKYYPKLEKRSDKGITPYNLRNCAFLDDFQKEKIIWLELTDKNKFTIENKFYSLAGVFLMTGSSLKYLLAFLNSKVIGWHFPFICNSSGVGTNQWKKVFVENLCIPKISKEEQKPFEILVDYILFAKKQDMKNEASLFEAVVDGMVYDLYFKDDMKKADCFISDEVTKVIKEFDDTSDMIQDIYKVFKNNKTIQRGLIYRRVIAVIKIIEGDK